MHKHTSQCSYHWLGPQNPCPPAPQGTVLVTPSRNGPRARSVSTIILRRQERRKGTGNAASHPLLRLAPPRASALPAACPWGIFRDGRWTILDRLRQQPSSMREISRAEQVLMAQSIDCQDEYPGSCLYHFARGGVAPLPAAKRASAQPPAGASVRLSFRLPCHASALERPPCVRHLPNAPSRLWQQDAAGSGAASSPGRAASCRSPGHEKPHVTASSIYRFIWICRASPHGNFGRIA